MNETSNSDTVVSISMAILIGSIIVAGSILWVGGRSLSTTNANNPAVAAGQTAPLAPAPAANDARKAKTANEPFIGQANAPVTIAYWFDYQCPFCQKNEQQVMPSLIKNYVDAGKVKIIFKDYPFLGPDSLALAIAARAVWEADSADFYTWHKAIFDAQGQENSGWATTNTINKITAQSLGATKAAQVASLIASKSPAYQAEIAADKAEGADFGVNGTPAMVVNKQFINGAVPYATIQLTVDSALKNS